MLYVVRGYIFFVQWASFEQVDRSSVSMQTILTNNINVHLLEQ
jgi:hypothetical protein